MKVKQDGASVVVTEQGAKRLEVTRDRVRELRVRTGVRTGDGPTIGCTMQTA